MAAFVERPQLRAGNLPREEARVREGDDDVGGSVEHQRGNRDASQATERVVRLPHRAVLSGEDARAHGMPGPFADLFLDEVGVCALKVLRVEDRACDPIRILRRPRALAEQCVLGSRLRVDARVAARRRGSEHQARDLIRMIDDKVLRDQASHGSAEHRSLCRARGREDGHCVPRHRREAHLAPEPRLADATRIEGDHAVMTREVADDGIEYRAPRAEPRDQQDGVSVARREDREIDTIGRRCGQTFSRHRFTIAAGRYRTMHAAMPRFFVDRDQIDAHRATLAAADSMHLARSLRARPGETIVVVEAGAVEHGVLLDEVTPARVSGRVVWSRPVSGEPRLEVHVLQAIPAQAMDATIEALTEVGVASIRPVLTTRTVSRPDVSRASHRLERWERIACGAAQLAGRAAPPEIHPVLALRDALESLPVGTTVLACVTHADALPILVAARTLSTRVALVVGPEGGLDTTDLAVLEEVGATWVHLGPRTLPSRMAGAVATALLFAGSGDLDAAAQPVPS
jgi:16S rRNA (uracil1498-N3)-methyltransferase